MTAMKPTWDEVPANTLQKTYFGAKDITYCTLNDGTIVLLDGQINVVDAFPIPANDPLKPTQDEIDAVVTADEKSR